MAKQTINQGTAPTGAGGDTFRTGSAKLQANDDEIYNYIEYSINDFNPQIRHTALIALLSAEDFKMNEKISEQVKKLMTETPPVRKTAAEVIKKYEIKFSQKEYEKVLENLGERALEGEKEALEKLVKK